MASAVSLEYLQSIEGQPNGLATLDNNGQLPAAQIPPTSELYKGEFPNPGALATAFPNAAQNNFAWVVSTETNWFWNDQLVPGQWVNSNIAIADYTLLTASQKAAVPYVILP